MRTFLGILCAAALALSATAATADSGLTVKGIRYFSYPGFTRIVFETAEAAPYVLTRSSDGSSLYFSSYGGPFVVTAAQLPAINDGVVKSLAVRQEGERRAIIISLGPAAGPAKDFVLRGPDRIVLDIQRGAEAVHESAEAARVPVVVLDPGHGGPDTGVVTSHGVEKVATLELADAVRRRLRKDGANLTVLLTRDRDRAMTIDERSAFSNAAGADLFVSLHAAEGDDARVFILDPDEGRSLPSSGGATDFQRFDAAAEHQQLLWGTQQAAHARASGRLGRTLARAFAGRDDAEPVQAPLIQLEAVDAAAVLVETGLGLNSAKTAETLARGIEEYVREKR